MSVIDDLHILDLFRERTSASGVIHGLCIGSPEDRWLVPEAFWNVTTVDPVRTLSQRTIFDAIVLHDLSRLESILKTRGFQPRRLLHEAVAMLEVTGSLFVSFRRLTLASLWRLPHQAIASLWKVSRRLNSLGLRVAKVLWLHDGMESPELYRVEEVYPTKGRPNLFRRAKFALAGSEVALIAQRNNPSSGPSWLWRLSRELPVDNCTAPHDVRVGSGGSYVVDVGKAIVRIPLQSNTVPRCRNNFAALQDLLATDRSLPVPRPVGSGELSSRRYFVESRLPGRSIDYRRTAARVRAKQSQAALAAIEAVHALTESLLTLGDAELDRLFRGPERELARLLDLKTAECLRQIVESFCAKLLGRRVRLARIHGDFKTGNILWTHHGRVAGIVDWDLSQAQGLPLVDHLTYRAFDHSLEHRISMAEALYTLGIAWQPGGPGARQVRGDWLDGLYFRACGLMALVHYAVNATIDDDEQRRLWCETYVTRWIKQACATLAEIFAVRMPGDSNDQ